MKFGFLVTAGDPRTAADRRMAKSLPMEETPIPSALTVIDQDEGRHADGRVAVAFNTRELGKLAFILDVEQCARLRERLGMLEAEMRRGIGTA